MWSAYPVTMAQKKSSSEPGGRSNDWESIFSDPDIGFIPLIESARTAEALRKSTHTVIRMLFTRDGDYALRQAYENELDEIISGDGGGTGKTCSFTEARAKVVDLLHSIKDARIKRDNSGKRDSDHTAPVSDGPTPVSDHTAPVSDDPTPAEECEDARLRNIFADTIWDWINQRLNILNSRVRQDRGEEDPLPFILSKKFAERFEGIVRRTVIPDLAERNRGLLHRVGERPEDQWKIMIRDYLEDRKGRIVMWESWQEAWKNKTLEKLLPPKPNAEKTMLSKFRKKNSEEERWKAETRRIKNINKAIRETWAEFTAPSKYFLPPEDHDNKLLMDIFGRNISNLKDQINAINQIVKQGGNAGMAFDRYQTGKNVDMALLAASYQSPEIFIGKGAALEQILKGHRGSKFPLIARYLPDHIKTT